MILAPRSPESRFAAVDISRSSVKKTRASTGRAEIGSVGFQMPDINCPAFREETFDHPILCFVFEGLADPVAALAELRRVLKNGSTLTTIEEDHGSAYFTRTVPRPQGDPVTGGQGPESGWEGCGILP